MHPRRSGRDGGGDGDDDASSAPYTEMHDSALPRSPSNNTPDPLDMSRLPRVTPPPLTQSFSSVYRNTFSNPASPSAASQSSRPIYQRHASGSNPSSPPHFFGSSLSAAASSPPLSTSTSSGSYLARAGSRTNSSAQATAASSTQDEDDDDLLEEKARNIPMTQLNVTNGSASATSPASSLPRSTSITGTGLGLLSKSAEENKSSLLNVPSSSSQSGSTPPYRPSTLSADDEPSQLDLDALEDEEATLLASGPLLKDYHSSTSSIRKDYTTVDWYFTKHNLGRIRRMIRLTNKAQGWKGKAMNAFIAAQGWIILFFVGVFTAASASFIHLVTEWLIDIKEGYCAAHGFFITKRVCCMVPGDCGWRTWGDGFDETGAYWFNYFIYILLALPMGCLASWFVHIYSKAAARSGLSEMKVMLGGFIIKKFLGIRTVMIKSLGVILGVSSGLSIGKLGPLVHIACCWGNIFARRFTKYNTNEVKKREILSASVAAGLSAAFGSPIGGVLFSLESLSSYFPPQTMWRSFWCSITAALCLGYIDPFQTGKLVQFGVTSNANQWNWREVPLFALIGCFGGFVGACFNHLNIKVNLYRKRNKWLYLHPVREVALLTLISAIINYPNIYLRGSSSALLAELFTNCRDVTGLSAYDTSASDNVHNALCPENEENISTNVPLMIGLLLCATITKFFFTALTYGCNVPSGVFMPGLVIGASIGRMVGWGLQQNFQDQGATGFFSQCIDKTYCVSPGLYAIIGAAAVLTGITRLTVSLAIVIYEVTGGLDYIAPIMITIVCAKWSADALGKQGFYAMRINQLHGYPWIDAYAEMELLGPAMDIMSRQPVCLTVYGTTLYSVKALLARYPYHGFPIIDNAFDQLIYGYIARSDLELLIDQNKEIDQRNPFVPVHFSHDPPPYPTPIFLDFSGSVDKYAIKILPHTPLDRVLGLFQGLGLRYVLVNSHKGQLQGIIKKKDLLVYIREHNGGQQAE